MNYLHTLFFLKKPFNVIMGRVSLPGQRADFTTKLKLPNKVEWGGDKLLCLGRSKESIETNDQLTQIRARIKAIWEQYKHMNITAYDVRDLFLIQGTDVKIPDLAVLNKDINSLPKKSSTILYPTTVLKSFDYYRQEKLKDGKSPNTLSFYENAGKAFKSFLETEMEAEDLPLKSINRPLFRAYKQFLEQKGSIGVTTAYQYAQAFATVLDFVIDEFQEDNLPNLPTSNVISSLIKPPKKDSAKKDGKKIPVDLEQKLWNFTHSPLFSETINERMQFWKHVMLWQWNTGMSFADLGTPQDWKYVEIHGKKFLEYQRQKTGVKSYAPMTETTDKILEYFDTVRTNKRLIPIDRFTDDKGVIIQKEYERVYSLYGVYLKHFKKVLGVKITTHMFRHSFGQNQVDSGQDLYNVSGMMGHSSVKTTEKDYTSVSPLRLSKKTGS